MERTIKIFKSFEEQELYHKQLMIDSTAKSRFIDLFKMQQWTKTFRPSNNPQRKIIIHKNGHPK